MGQVMVTNFAYSTMVIKAVDEDKREFTGIASTPEPDRVNDVMIPKGAKFKLPMAFLWQHDHKQPIGQITEVRVTDKGIEVKGVVEKVDAPSQLAARLDEAWVSIKKGLVRGLSIGFRPIKYAFLDGGGVEYSEWDWYELSAVTIPMNANGGITSVKSFDREVRAALGIKDETTKTFSGVTEKKSIKSVKLTPKEGKEMSIAEKIKGFEDELRLKRAKLEEMMTKSLESGETFDAESNEAYETLESEVKALEVHIQKAQKLLSTHAVKATPVTEVEGNSEIKSLGARNSSAMVKLRPQETLEKGIAFTRYVMALAKAKGDHAKAANIAIEQFGEDSTISRVLSAQAKGADFGNMMKAAVASGSTITGSGATWGNELVDFNTFVGDFIDFLRPKTIIGQFGVNGIPSLRNIPFNVKIKGQDGAAVATWVGEGLAKPVTSMSFNQVELGWYKVACIAVITEELIRFSSPSAERLVREELARAVIERLDTDFINPAKAAVAGVSPASILNGITGIESSGTDADSINCDLQTLEAEFIEANNEPDQAVYIMRPQLANVLGRLQNPLGQTMFPGINMRGGTLLGTPVIVSNYVPAGIVALVNASDIYIADDGQVTVDASREATIQMDTAPTQSSVAPTATTGVSMFQTNSVAIRAERHINWARRRDVGVAYLTNVAWSSCATIAS